MNTVTRWTLAAVFGLCLAAPAWAGAPTDHARQYTDQVLKVLGDPTLKPAERRATVRKVAGEVFDVSETARRALGRHWRSRSPAEREEFIELFADVLESTYISKIDSYGGERLSYFSESVEGDFAIVRARVLGRRADVPVEARMHRRGDRWYIYDIAVDGVSLINNYRSQFDRIIQTSSYEELIRRLQSKRNEMLNSR